jgi:phosphoglycolate phosphatase
MRSPAGHYIFSASITEQKQMASIKLCVFDVAGTTARDDGLVLRAFHAAVSSVGIHTGTDAFAKMTDYVNATMGQRKIDVFKALFPGDSARAEQAHARFVAAYNELVGQGLLEAFDGVLALFDGLAQRGIGVAITTGFPREILDRVLVALGWQGHVDVAVAASEVPCGRPAPDMVLRCLALYNAQRGACVVPEEVCLVGDTPSDMQSGLAAGAGRVVGVTTGIFAADALYAAGATHVLPAVAALPTLGFAVEVPEERGPTGFDFEKYQPTHSPSLPC